jgi:hypothetical protein
MPVVLIALLFGTGTIAWAANRPVRQTKYLWIVRGRRAGINREALIADLQASGYQVYSVITNPADGTWVAEVSGKENVPPSGNLAMFYGILETRAV